MSSSSYSSSSSSSDEDEEEPQIVPKKLHDYLEVGDTFLQKSGLSSWFGAWPSDKEFHYVSDCSGADVPFFGLSMLFESAKKSSILKHKAASEIHPKKRKFLEKNVKPEMLTTSVLQQDNTSLEENVSLYCAGFPCTPYSMLGERECLSDVNSKQLFACVRRMKICRPKVAILENVMGFMTVADKVAKFIAANMPWYRMLYVTMNPTGYGAPLSRRRLYLLLIRESALTDEASRMDLLEFIQEKLKAMHVTSSKTPWKNLLLPKKDPAVKKDMDKRRQRGQISKRADPKAKWIQRHNEWAKTKKVSLKNSMKSFAKKYPDAAKHVTSMREMQALDPLLADNRELSLVNTSQSLAQMPFLTTDSQDLPCLTPSGKFLSTSAGRYIIGREVMALMGIPIHRLRLDSFSESVLHSLGGNAMHMRSVLPLICAALAATVPDRLAM